jgi:hypothetical protein
MEYNNDNLKKVQEIISDYKNKSNKDITFALDYLNNDFEFTKQTIIKLTEHLDEVELLYNKLLDEYKLRNDG